MARPARIAALVTAAAALAASPAGAQPSADALLREGVELRAQGRDAEAFERFRAAWTSSPTPRARAQMGWAAQALGRWREADRMLREALGSPGDPWIAANLADLTRSLGEVNTRLGDLAVVCEVAGARIYVDGELVGTAPLAGPTRAPVGGVTLRVEADGYIAVTREGVRVRSGEVAREHIALTPVPTARTHQDPPAAPTPPPPAPPAPTVLLVPVAPGPTPRASLAPLGYALLGVGVAGAATSALGFALRESAVSRYDEGVRQGACVGADLPAASEADPRCYDDRGAMETWGVVRWVGLGVGVAGVAAGVTLLILDAPRGGGRAVACGPWAGALGAVCAARF